MKKTSQEEFILTVRFHIALLNVSDKCPLSYDEK